MKRIEYFERIASLLEFKSIFDDDKNEYVVFKTSPLSEIGRIDDKTEFESSENHVHLLGHVSKEEFSKLNRIAPVFAQTVLFRLKSHYPDKKFIVYVTVKLNDSMIVRFHQKWDGEAPYCNPSEFNSPKEKVFAFES